MIDSLAAQADEGHLPSRSTLAMVPLAPNARLSASAITADLARQWPELPNADSIQASDEYLAFRIGSQDIIISRMPVPIPWSDLEGPCATSWLWPEAASVLKQHEAHLIVLVLSDDGPVQRATLLTQAITSILATCAEAVGVYWGAATLVVSPEVFQELATGIREGELPLYLWVDFRVGQSTESQSWGFTTGMAALGHMELETLNAPESPGDLADRLFGLADYILENGPVIQDGHTVGKDANERIRVRHTDSAVGHEGRVMRLEFPETTSGKPRRSRG